MPGEPAPNAGDAMPGAGLGMPGEELGTQEATAVPAADPLSVFMGIETMRADVFVEVMVHKALINIKTPVSLCNIRHA